MKTVEIKSKKIADLFVKKQKIGEDNKEAIEEITRIGKENQEMRAKVEANDEKLREYQPLMGKIEEESMKYNKKIQEEFEALYSDEIGEDEHFLSAEIKDDKIIGTIKSKEDYMNDYEAKVSERFFAKKVETTEE